MGDMHDYSGYGNYGDAAHDTEFVGAQMNDAQGFDDQFNDGVARTALRGSVRQRPDQWPSSASEMGRRVAYQDAGIGEDSDVAMLRSSLSTSGRVRPEMWAKSASEMKGYVDFQEGQVSGDIDDAHLRTAGRGLVPPPSRGGWVFSLREGRWVRG